MGQAIMINDIRILAAVAIWSLPWKGYALWLAARKNKKAWFIALLVLNTLAILDILYIFVFSKKEKPKDKLDPTASNNQHNGKEA